MIGTITWKTKEKTKKMPKDVQSHLQKPKKGER
jgi:hypothetical protein